MRSLMTVMLLLGACAEGAVDVDDDGTETETETESESESQTEDTRWVPTAFSVFSQFAVDPEGYRLKGWTADGQATVPFVAMRLYPASPDTRTCTVYMIMDEPGAIKLKAWAWEDATPDAKGQFMEHVGFFVPDDARVEVVNCEEINQDVFGEPGDTVSRHLWGVGVGELRTDVSARFGTDIKEGFYMDAFNDGTLLGGSWNSNVWEPAIWGSHVAVASELDDEDVLTVDGDGWPEGQILRDDVLVETAALPDAHYLLSGILAYDADAYLY